MGPWRTRRKSILTVREFTVDVPWTWGVSSWHYVRAIEIMLRMINKWRKSSVLQCHMCFHTQEHDLERESVCVFLRRRHVWSDCQFTSVSRCQVHRYVMPVYSIEMGSWALHFPKIFQPLVFAAYCTNYLLKRPVAWLTMSHVKKFQNYFPRDVCR